MRKENWLTTWPLHSSNLSMYLVQIHNKNERKKEGKTRAIKLFLNSLYNLLSENKTSYYITEHYNLHHRTLLTFVLTSIIWEIKTPHRCEGFFSVAVLKQLTKYIQFNIKVSYSKKQENVLIMWWVLTIFPGLFRHHSWDTIFNKKRRAQMRLHQSYFGKSL